MVGKIVAILVSGAVLACGLLVMRQERIDLAHDIAVSHWRTIEHEQSIWRMRVVVHERLASEEIARLTERYAARRGLAMKPLHLPPDPEPVLIHPVPDPDADRPSVPDGRVAWRLGGGSAEDSGPASPSFVVVIWHGSDPHHPLAFAALGRPDLGGLG